MGVAPTHLHTRNFCCRHQFHPESLKKGSELKMRQRPTFGLLLSLCCLGQAFYLPGLAPVTYCDKPTETGHCTDDIKLFVNRLNSEESVIPYEYEHFDFCLANAEKSAPAENLGQVVFGERIRPSPYNIKFNQDKGMCKKVC